MKLPVRTLAMATAAAIVACTPSSSRTDPLVSSAGTSLTTAYTEARTVSVALDRIDQRALPLDRTYRHFGTGRDVSVYVFDGGVLDTHPELAGRVRRGYDAFPNEEHICNAHGTAVAGAVAGTTLGVAPAAEIVDVKMVECRRMRGTIDAIVRGTEWTIADHAKHPERRAVANWSFIADTAKDIPELDSAVAHLRAAGIPVIVSAGNVDIDACHVSPGNAPGTIVVGASRVTRLRDTAHTMVDARAANTAWGRCVSVFAPGDSVLLPSFDEKGMATTQLWTGTSMSAGYVSGAAALYLETHPAATPDEVGGEIRREAQAGVDARSPQAGLLYVGR